MTLYEDIQCLLDRMAQAYAAGDATACAGMFTEDATLHSPFAPPAHGRAEIEALHRDWTRSATAKRFDVLAFGGSGNLAWVLARFSEGETGTGTTLAVLEQNEGASWLCRVCSLNDEQDMVKKHHYGESYPPYHHLRVYDATDCLARIFTRIAGLEIDSDEYTYVRQLVRAWREANFNAYRTDGMRTENAFLDLYDTDVRLRRLNHLSSMIDDLLRADDASVHPHQRQLSDLRASVEVQIGRLRDDIRKLASRTRSPLLEQECLQELQKVLQTDKEKAAESYAAVMGGTDREDRFERAKEVYGHADIKPHVDTLMVRIGEVMAETFNANREDMNARLPAGEDAPLKQVREAFQDFHWHDVLSLPFLEGSGAREHSEVQTFRISPAESSHNPSPNKLAGIALHAFGGFLDREWREHDILWGRLDGAQRIIAALLPDPDQAALRKSYTDEAHEIILTETFAADGEVLNKRVLGWLLQRVEKRGVVGPEVEKLKSNELDVEHELSVFKNLKSGKDRRTFFQKQYEKPRGAATGHRRRPLVARGQNIRTDDRRSAKRAVPGVDVPAARRDGVPVGRCLARDAALLCAPAILRAQAFYPLARAFWSGWRPACPWRLFYVPTRDRRGPGSCGRVSSAVAGAQVFRCVAARPETGAERVAARSHCFGSSLRRPGAHQGMGTRFCNTVLRGCRGVPATFSHGKERS